MCVLCTYTAPSDEDCVLWNGGSNASIQEIADAAGNVATAYHISAGDSFSGSLSAGDEDWVRINLTAGTSYEINVRAAGGGGGTASDTTLTVYDSSGAQVGFNDDGGPSLDSSLTYTATTSGSYYLSVRHYYSTGTGTYTLTVDEPTPPPVATLDQLANYLTHGYWQDQGGQNRAFDTSSNRISVDLTGISDAAKQLARWALESWELVANIEFEEVNQSAQITFHDSNASGAYAISNLSGNEITSSSVYVANSWLNSYGTTIDSYSFATYIHEIGHALGLGHQGDYNGNASYSSDADFANDSTQLSVMSYFSQTDNTTTDASYATVASPMIADIIAIQNLYGAPSDLGRTAGNTTWGTDTSLGGMWDYFSATLDQSAPPQIFDGGPITMTIYDQGGIDTLDLSASSGDDRISLWHSAFSDVNGLTGNLAIARNTLIENLVAGSGNNIAFGNGASNLVITDGGNDTVWANDGDDTVYGGDGNDLLSGGDGIDDFWGGNGNDTIYGENGDDFLGGAAGDDVAWGGWGNDNLFGDSGNDTLGGSQGNDTAWAGAGNDLIYGEADHDRLGGGVDHDTIWGGDGNDTIYGYVGDDQVEGGNGEDELWAGTGDDIVNGGGGRDTIWGVSGNDTINGGTESDRLTGDDGADHFVFVAGHGNDTITDFDITEGDRLRLDDAAWISNHGSLSADQVVSRFATLTANGVTFDFGGENQILLQGINDLTVLSAAIDIA